MNFSSANEPSASLAGALVAGQPIAKLFPRGSAQSSPTRAAHVDRSLAYRERTDDTVVVHRPLEKKLCVVGRFGAATLGDASVSTDGEVAPPTRYA